ncbi:hypothetical protein [Rhizobium giardinii]|uniref:hypothetical protein n=1 Tax=Rhizobium giardinii TaxID=56731 RepID=UPI003D6FCFC2
MRHLLFGLIATFVTSTASAACIDIAKTPSPTFEGRLIHKIFPGPPNYEDVRQGDQPEPAFILNVTKPFCIVGDEMINDETQISRIHVFSEDIALMPFVDHDVIVSGKELFGGSTAHHRAPVVLSVAAIEDVPSYDAFNPPSGLTTVQSFYLALEAGDGNAATNMVIEEKRRKGPLSAKSLTAYYGNMKEALELKSVTPIFTGKFRVRYTFRPQNGGVCNGSSIVTVTRRGDLNLIERISSESGC